MRHAAILALILALPACGSGGADAGGSGSTSSSSGSSSGSGPCSSAAPPAGTFTSDQAIAAATCLAQSWHADAILDGIEFGPATKGWQAGGKDFDWGVTFVSPGTQCMTVGGLMKLPTTTFDVNSKYPTIGNPGGTCEWSIGVAACPPGIGKPVDSSVLYAAAEPKLQAMAGGATVTITGALEHSCILAPAPAVNYINWVMTGSWMGASGAQMGVVNFDAGGAIKSSVGPCSPSDFTCLGG